MIKKYFLPFVSAALLCLACTPADPEDNQKEDPTPEAPTEYSFEACCVDEIISAELERSDVGIETKSSYASDIMFKWSSDDKIAMVCKNGSGEEKLICLSTTTAGTMSTFKAPAEEGWKPTGLFFYPYNDNLTYCPSENGGIAQFKYVFPQRTDRCADASRVDIPMIGQVADDGVIEFKHACGALKSRFKGLEPSKKYTLLFTSNRYTYGEHAVDAVFGATFQHDMTLFAYHDNTGDMGSLVLSTSTIVDFCADETGYAEVYMLLDATTHNWHRFELYNDAMKVVYNSKSTNANIKTGNNMIVIMPVIDLATDELNENYQHLL